MTKTGRLILARRTGERIMIGNDIVVEVMEIRRDLVKIGIIAPPEASVDREEVWARKNGVEIFDPNC